MEQAKHWMWAARKPHFNPAVFPLPGMNSYGGDSWEEQAFAEDAAGALGGCVWPPRSYSCSFCRREFRSAQALGGHMNVHRRDRARLKQSSPILSTDHHRRRHVVSDQSRAPVNPYSSDQMSTFLYNNPNPDYLDAGPMISPIPCLIRVSSPPSEDVPNRCFFSPVGHSNNKGLTTLSHPASPRFEKRDQVVLDSIRREEKKPVSNMSSRIEKEDTCVTEDLSMSLNLVVCRKRMNTSSDHDEVGSCKRRRIEEKPLSFFTKLGAVDRCLPQPEVLKLCSGSSEEVLDLELRLGHAPKVKQIWKHRNYY